MTKWIRSLSAVFGTLVLAGALHAAPPPPPDGPTKPRPSFPRPAPELPTYTIKPLCTTAPAPQVQVNIQNVYVQLTWAPVAGAVNYQVGRSVPARAGTAVALTTTFAATEYWDAAPDIRDAYQYTVTAVQADGCMGSTSVAVNGPFATPNPRGLGGSHPSPMQTVLTWPEQFGATSYRIDGPGIPNTGLYLDGTRFESGKKPAMIGVPKTVNNTTTYELSATVSGQGVASAWYTISAQYPNAADYNTPGRVFIPRVKPVITSISPTSGTIGQTVVTIRGQYLSDPSDGQPPSVVFGASQNPYAPVSGTTANKKSVSPTEITAVASASGYIRVSSYAALPTGGYTSSGSGLSPTPFAGAQAPPPPPAPPPQVLVPGVVGLSLSGAIQVLQNAGFMPVGASGPAGPGAIVQRQDPQGGARAPQGSTVSLTTVGTVNGFSEITLYNNMPQQRSVNLWLFDQASGQWSGGSAVGFGSTGKFELQSGRMYFVLALDPTKCGGQNNPTNAACEYWRLPGVPGDENGPPQTVAIN